MTEETSFDNKSSHGRNKILRHLRESSNRIYVEIGILYVAIFAFLALARISYSSLPPISLLALTIYVAAFLGIGWCQFSLTHALHEVVHYNCGKNHNEFLGALFTMYPLGLTKSYRYVHFDHHKYFAQANKDPEHKAYSAFPKSKLQLVGRLLKNASGLITIRQFFTQKASINKHSVAIELLRLSIVQAFIFLLFAVFMHWWLYLFLWILPILTIAKLLSSTRAFCEHGSPDNIPVFRTITGNPIQTLLLGMFHFNYHAEHHAHPAVPYTNLRSTHDVMLLNTEQIEGVTYEHCELGYLGLLFKWFRQLPFRARVEY